MLPLSQQRAYGIKAWNQPQGEIPRLEAALRYTCQGHVLEPHPLHPRHSLHCIPAPLHPCIPSLPAFCSQSLSYTTAGLRPAAGTTPVRCLAPTVASAEMSLWDHRG